MEDCNHNAAGGSSGQVMRVVWCPIETKCGAQLKPRVVTIETSSLQCLCDGSPAITKSVCAWSSSNFGRVLKTAHSWQLLVAGAVWASYS